MLLDVSNLTKSYNTAEGRVTVLSGVALTLDAGETLALQGESGSGKSTLLHVIGGLEPADGGTVRIADRDIAGLDESGRAAMRREEIGIVFQQFNLIPSLDAAANIRFQARLSGRVDEAQIAQIVGAFGLEAHLRKYPEQLSGGQQQRVAIARALATRPSLILADEPTGNLDEATSEDVLSQMLASVADLGAALMVVTHSPAVAARMDRQIFLRSGRLA